MFKRSNKGIYLLLVIIIGMFFNVSYVNAEKATVSLAPESGGKLYYYTTKDNKYGSYYGTSSSNMATKYTRIKTLNGQMAYCAQADTYSPKEGEVYEEVSWGETLSGGKLWNETEAIVAGYLMYNLARDYNDNNSLYVLRHTALNSYLGLNKSLDFAAYNTTLEDYVMEAILDYRNSHPNDDLPSFRVSAVDDVLEKYTTKSKTYYVGEVELIGLDKSYGGGIDGDDGEITYKFVLPDDVELYDDEDLSEEADLTFTGVDGDRSYFIKYTGNDVGESIRIKVIATNSSVYPMARIWRPTASDSQMLVTYGTTEEYERTLTRSDTFEIPNVDKKTIKVIKKDAETGEVLTGSTLKLQLSGGSTKACTITSGNYSCSISIDEDLVGDTYYSIVESVAPNGYIKGSSIDNVKWDIKTASNQCYATGANNKLSETNMEDCERNYVVSPVCTVDEGVSYTDGHCEVKVRDDLPEGQEPTEEDYVTVGTEETVCHYVDGSSAKKVEEAKCSTQFVKVSNSSGNLVVEYYNTKNHVEISKYAISGDKELIGAELKICSNKPNDKGECTIVKNTSEGVCLNKNTSGGQVNLSSEYNCVNNNDGTKTMDMRWISGGSSKIWYGLPKGTYYLVETIAPIGYLPISTAIEFTIDGDGNITSDAYNSELKKIIVENKPTGFKVNKIDAENGKNVSGVTLSICTATLDNNKVWQLDVGEDGYCVPAKFANGNVATWVTDDKVKSISGLAVGVYYLVEIAAPSDYATAEPILFMVNEDGSLTDKDGNLIQDNELVMKNVRIVNEKTGEVPVLGIILLGAFAIAICGGSYYYLIKKDILQVIINKIKKKN